MNKPLVAHRNPILVGAVILHKISFNGFLTDPKDTILGFFSNSVAALKSRVL